MNILAEKRKKIDDLDARITILLAERLRIAASLKELKKKARDPRREAEVLEHAAGLIKDTNLRPAVLAVYREIIKQSRLIQLRP